MIETWRLDDTRQTLVLASIDQRMAEVVYWGRCLPKDEDLSQLVTASRADLTAGMIDANPSLSICPIEAFPGQPGLMIRRAAEELRPRFQFVKAVQPERALILSFEDAELGLRYTANFLIDDATGVLECDCEVQCDAYIVVEWLAAPVLPAPQYSEEMIDYAGRWCGEFQAQRIAWSGGARLRESRVGRTDYSHFPGLCVPCCGATHTMGEAYAFHFGWSGGHRMVAEELPDGRRQIQFGRALAPQAPVDGRVASATLFATYSSVGLNGCAQAFQRHVRERVVQWPAPERPRPVHYNCWEAVYFDHDLETLKGIATQAAGLGAERFVLDDGWFGTRDDATSSLGDWVIDRRKWPDGLGPLIAHLHSVGMTFGLWFEPEMVNPDSDLYRAHPEWILGPADQTPGRGQMVLDLTRAGVTDYLYSKIAALLSTYEIEYIKWDHNRVLPYVNHAQTTALGALLSKIRQAFAKVEIESCASGGGRIDYGILGLTQRVWLSDSNDALERLRIQHDAAQFLPSVVTGSHVGPRTCHTSGRTIDMAFRAWVAAQRHMGFEMDPRELTDDETATLRHVTDWWKANRDWMCRADILRLDHTDPSVLAEQHMGKDRFVVFAGQAATSRQILPRPLRLTALEPDATYRIELTNREEAAHLSKGPVALRSGPIEVSGAYLMHQGLTLPWRFPETMWVLEGQRI